MYGDYIPQYKDAERSWYPEGLKFITNLLRYVCVVGGIIVKNIILFHRTHIISFAFYVYVLGRSRCAFSFCIHSKKAFKSFGPLAYITSAIAQFAYDATTNRFLCWRISERIFHLRPILSKRLLVLAFYGIYRTDVDDKLSFLREKFQSIRK